MPSTKRQKDPIELDGRTLEGGGQLLRIALCLSALTSQRIRISNIRGNRGGGGGLKAQHLACVKWLARASNARVEGATKGSKTLLFSPGPRHSDLSPAFTKRTAADGSQVYACSMEIETVGSTALALQAVLPYILFTKFPTPLPVEVTLSGGTNVSGSPSFDYITHVLLPTLHSIGFPPLTTTLVKRGWATGGNSSIGTFILRIPARTSTVLPAFHLPATTLSSTRQPPIPTKLHAILLGPVSLHQHIQTTLPRLLATHLPAFSPSPTNLQITTEDSQNDQRLYFLLIATLPSPTPSASPVILARDSLAMRKIRTLSQTTTATSMAEAVVAELAAEIRSGTAVDEHMRDQLVIFQALARGRSGVFGGRELPEKESDAEGSDEENEDLPLREPSLHARTAEWVAKQMLGVRFDAEGSCEGIGFGAAESEDVEGEELAEKIGELEVG